MPGSPVVTLNRAVAAAMVHGPAGVRQEHQGEQAGDLGGRAGLRFRGDPDLAVAAGGVTAPLVDHPPRRCLQQPAARLRRCAVRRPVPGGSDQRLLHRVLGRVEVAPAAGERAEDLRRQFAQQVLDVAGDGQRGLLAVSRYAFISSTPDGPSSMIRRTWMGCCVGTPPRPGTAETSPAISSARSSDSTSTIW